MVIQSKVNLPHWNYLLAIERDLGELSRYVEFVTENFKCFSIETAKVLLSAASETDVVCKQICRVIDPKSSAAGIEGYRQEILPKYPDIPAFPVLLPRFGLTLTPWEEWGKGGVPRWWTANNKLKHHREANYHEANLQNALNAVAGLFVMVIHLYREEAMSSGLTPRPLFLNVDIWNARHEDYNRVAYQINSA